MRGYARHWRSHRWRGPWYRRKPLSRNRRGTSKKTPESTWVFAATTPERLSLTWPWIVIFESVVVFGNGLEMVTAGAVASSVNALRDGGRRILVLRDGLKLEGVCSYRRSHRARRRSYRRSAGVGVEKNLLRRPPSMRTSRRSTVARSPVSWPWTAGLVLVGDDGGETEI